MRTAGEARGGLRVSTSLKAPGPLLAASRESESLTARTGGDTEFVT